MTPEEALERARAAAGADPGPPLRPEPVAPLDAGRLYGWAFIEPDESLVYSTRRFGAPMTLLKRVLLRILRQYHAQVLAQQTRFNVQAAAVLINQEERLRELEARERGAG